MRMGLTAGAVAAFASPWTSRTVTALAAAEAGNADLVVINARVYTVDSRMPRAEALAVKDARFIAVGTNDEIRGLAGKDTQTIDAKQMTIVPGFIDCHNHEMEEVRRPVGEADQPDHFAVARAVRMREVHTISLLHWLHPLSHARAQQNEAASLC